MRKRFDPAAVLEPRPMKKLPFPTNKAASEAMRKAQEEALASCDSDLGELWVRDRLWRGTTCGWARKAIWGCRLFDFWSADLGIAVQIDRDEQDAEIEAYADEYNYRRSGILVLRVEPYNEDDMAAALAKIELAETWGGRRERLGNLIASGSQRKKPKKAKRRDFPACFVAFREDQNAPRRYTRRDNDWLVEVWRFGGWHFHDSVGYETANEAFAEGSCFLPTIPLTSKAR